MDLANKIDFANKLTISELDEVADGLGTEIINYLPLNMSAGEHLTKIRQFEERIKGYKLTTQDIYIDRGEIGLGKLLSEQFELARENLNTYYMIQGRFG